MLSLLFSGGHSCLHLVGVPFCRSLLNVLGDSLLYQAREMYLDKGLICRSAGPDHDGQKSEEL